LILFDDSQKMTLTVPDTGGFQAFVPLNLGRVKLRTTGQHRLLIKPIKKNKAAVMDVRQITLKPVIP